MVALRSLLDTLRRWEKGCFLFAVSAFGICACVPIPIPGGGVAGEIPETTRATIVPGSSTRADVLLLLAEPYKRGEEDHYFLYSSSQFRGGVLLVALLYYPIPVAEASGHRCRLLAIQFDAGGTVTKVRAFEGETQSQSSTLLDRGRASPGVCEADTALNEAIMAWLSEP